MYRLRVIYDLPPHELVCQTIHEVTRGYSSIGNGWITSFMSEARKDPSKLVTQSYWEPHIRRFQNMCEARSFQLMLRRNIEIARCTWEMQFNALPDGDFRRAYVEERDSPLSQYIAHQGIELICLNDRVAVQKANEDGQYEEKIARPWCEIIMPGSMIDDSVLIARKAVLSQSNQLSAQLQKKRIQMNMYKNSDYILQRLNLEFRE